LAWQAYDYAFVDDGSLTNGENMKVVGILAPKEEVSYGCMDSGLYFTKAFAEHYLEQNMESEVTKFIRAYCETNPDADGFTSAVINFSNHKFISGIGFIYDVNFPDGIGSSSIQTFEGAGLIGEQNALSGIMSLIGGGGSGGSSSSILPQKMALCTLRDVGGNSLPGTIKIYPKSFADKYLVTDYLDRWQSEETITLSTGTVLTPDQRNDIKYTDNLAIIIALINGVINIVTIALVAFTSLSLIVSTVMIGIITYVSVMERVKEIGVIRSLGGRKRDVSHLFNAETLIIGSLSGVFGLIVTYLFEIILNATIGVYYGIGMIANLSWWTAVVILALSIALTMLAGIIPARAAARQDPVVALRTE
jgi:putative ABC transport system permease protein